MWWKVWKIWRNRREVNTAPVHLLLLLLLLHGQWTGQCAWRLGTVVVASPCRRACRVRAWQLAASSSPFPAAGALPQAFARSRAGQEAVAEPGLSWTPGRVLNIVVTKTRRRQTHSSKDTREHNGSSKDTREHNGKIENIQQVSSRSSIFILLQQFFGLLQQFFGPNPGPWHGWPGVYIRPCWKLHICICVK